MLNTLVSSINHNTEIKNNFLSFPSNNSFDSSQINNFDSSFLNNNPNFNLNIKEISEIFNFCGKSSNNEDESLNNLYVMPYVDNNNIKKINPNTSISINNSQKTSAKIFNVVNSEQSFLTDKKLMGYIRKMGNFNNLNNKKTHTGGDDDNLIRKIQIHFINFVRNYVNDVIRTQINGKNVPQFQDLKHEIKKMVSHKHVEWLKSLSLAEILQLEVSSKMKVHGDDVNKKIYEEICNLIPFMREFLQKKYIDLFKEYYDNKNKVFLVDGRLINLSKKTKVFSDLKKKYNKYSKRLNYIAINYFLNCYKRIRKPKFKTSA